MTSILKVAVPSPLRQLFDYLPCDSDMPIHEGSRVLISFGRRKLVGIVWEITDKSDLPLNKLKPIEKVLDPEPVLSPTLKKICRWLQSYYHHPIGEVCATVLPNPLRQYKETARKQVDLTHKENQHQCHTTSQSPFGLNSAQADAVQSISSKLDQFQAFLLKGVTSSGKTEVYLQAIEKVIAEGKQALVLIPEIGLTPQTLQRFQDRFGENCIAWHSGLTEKARLEAWLKARNEDAQIIIGTRSAIFMPLKNPGIIIVDEEHDLSFKQQDGLRYSARDLAIYRGQLENIPVVLGSATPSLESLNNAKQNRYQLLSLPERAGAAVHPDFHIIDIRNVFLENGLSPALIEASKQHLAQGNQVLLFLNRRGFSPTIMCHECGWISKCPRCDMNMTFHQTKNKLICHHCDKQKIKPANCPECGGDQLIPVGVGTERLETALSAYFPDTKITRIDRDSTRKKNALNDLLEEVHSGEPQILIGTQMLAKGHHFPKVTMVGIINADSGFFSSDFRAIERMGQLVTQVAGRAGRENKKGEVYIQSHQPDNPLLQTLIKKGYSAFAEQLLQERTVAMLPPFSYFALIRAEATKANIPENFLQHLKHAKGQAQDDVTIFGPIPAPMPKRAGKHRAQLLINASNRKSLHAVLNQLVQQTNNLKETRSVRWSIDVDPLEMF